jgi:hypothetical protein
MFRALYCGKEILVLPIGNLPQARLRICRQDAGDNCTYGEVRSWSEFIRIEADPHGWACIEYGAVVLVKTYVLTIIYTLPVVSG